MTFTKRVVNLQPEGAYEVLARAQEMEADGRKIIHLEVGEPDFQTFPHISQAGVRAIHEGHTRYNPPAGLRRLREVIADKEGQRRGMKVRPAQVLISPGAKPNMFFPALALIEPGDEVVYPDPGFPTYLEMIKVAGGVPKPVRLLEENSFSFDLEDFDRLVNDRTKLIILNSPANPTGGVIPADDLAHIAQAAQRYDCWVISDEIYSRLAYDGLEVPSIASLPGMAERTVIVDGFSKTYAMTGWRLGYGIMPADLARRVELLLTHALGCTADFTQHAGVAAILGPQHDVEAAVEVYRNRRDLIVERLNSLPGVHCKKPQGAFYAFPNVKALGTSSKELANLVLEQAGVALLPGTAFGRYGEGYLRLSYANTIENITDAMDGMQELFIHLAA